MEDISSIILLQYNLRTSLRRMRQKRRRAKEKCGQRRLQKSYRHDILSSCDTSSQWDKYCDLGPISSTLLAQGANEHTDAYSSVQNLPFHSYNRITPVQIATSYTRVAPTFTLLYRGSQTSYIWFLKFCDPLWC